MEQTEARARASRTEATAKAAHQVTRVRIERYIFLEAAGRESYTMAESMDVMHKARSLLPGSLRAHELTFILISSLNGAYNAVTMHRSRNSEHVLRRNWLSNALQCVRLRSFDRFFGPCDPSCFSPGLAEAKR